MIVLSVYYKHKAGGFNQRLYQLYKALADRGHQVHYVALETLPLRHANVRPHVLRLPVGSRENSLFWGVFLIMSPFFCFWIARRYRVDRIVVFSSTYAAIGALAAGLLRIPMITFLRADVLREAGFDHKARLRRMFLRGLDHIGMNLSSLVVTNSCSLSQRVSNRHPEIRTAIVVNSIETEMHLTAQERANVRGRYGLGKEDFVIVTTAPFNPVKNLDFLIQAFAACGLPSAFLWLIGEDVRGKGEGRRLQRLVFDLNLEARVRFTGWLDDPRPTMAAADLFVIPSLQEGCPNALLEAMACGLACLGSRIPEIREILQHEELLFSLESVMELQHKLRKAANDGFYLRHLAELSRSRKERYRFEWDARVAAQISNPAEQHE